MTYEEKQSVLLENIALKRKLTPAGRVTKITYDREEYWTEFDDICKLLLQLQDDYKVLTITDTLQPIEELLRTFMNENAKSIVVNKKT